MGGRAPRQRFVGARSRISFLTLGILLDRKFPVVSSKRGVGHPLRSSSRVDDLDGTQDLPLPVWVSQQFLFDQVHGVFEEALQLDLHPGKLKQTDLRGLVDRRRL